MTHFLFRNDLARTANTVVVDGVALPPTKSYKVQYYDLQTNSYRDITPNALLHKETICRDKVKLVMEWGYLSSTEAKSILGVNVDSEFTHVRFWNPLVDDFSEGNLYRGDREVTIYRAIERNDGSGKLDCDYSGLTMNLIMQ